MLVLEYAKNINELLALLITIITSAATLIGLIYSHLKRKKAENNISKQLSTIDEVQNAKLQQMDATMQELSVILLNTQEILNMLQKDKHEKEFLDNLKVKIIDLGDKIIRIHELDSAFESLITEATEKAGGVFKDIWRTGYSNWDSDVIGRKITSAMRGLRTYYSGNVSTPPDVISEIQKKVAEPAIKRLLVTLDQLKTGVYNGSTQKEYEKEVLNFCRSMIEGGIEINKKYSHKSGS